MQSSNKVEKIVRSKPYTGTKGGHKLTSQEHKKVSYKRQRCLKQGRLGWR